VFVTVGVANHVTAPTAEGARMRGLSNAAERSAESIDDNADGGAAAAPGCPPGHAAGDQPEVGPGPAGRRGRSEGLGREASGFAAVGAIGLLVDIGGYNALVHLGGDGLLADQPLVAKAISLVAGTTVAYFGNRFWTYRDRPRRRLAREYTLYMFFSGVALAIALGCLAVSRYVLGLANPVADNVAANGIGLALGSLFRFFSYRRYVFPDQVSN
jgi:putative flippase GtrA